MRSTRALLSSALALALGAVPALAAPRGKAPPAALAVSTPVGAGHVTYVTSEQAFVDRGKREGVVVGQALPVFRGPKQLGTCTVTGVSDSQAACTPSAFFKVGDRVGGVDRKALPPTAAFPAVPTSDELERVRRQVEQQPWELVDAEAARSVLRGTLGLSVALSHQGFVDFGSKRPAYGIERLDAQLVDLRVAKDVAVSVDATALLFTGRPTADRYPGGTLTLLVHRAQAKWTPAGTPFLVQVGRLRPRGTPGLRALDGVQAGWRSASTDVEAGVFGGLLPTSALLGLGVGAGEVDWAAGAYGLAKLVRGRGNDGARLQVEGRAGWATRPNLGTRFEAGVTARGWVTRLVDAHLTALLSSGSPVAPSVVDSAGLDVGLRPTETFRLHVAARYRGNPQLETALPGVALPATRGLHAGLDGWVELQPGLEVGLRGGMAQDAVGAFWVGPELAMTQVLGGRAAFAVGYQEEVGTLPGRSAYGQATFAPASSLRFTGRASWAMQKSAVPLGGSDVGATLIADVRPVSWGWVRASGTWRTALAVGAEDVNLMRGSLAQVLLQIGADF